MDCNAAPEHRPSLLESMSQAINEGIHKVIDPIKEALAPDDSQEEPVGQTVVSEPSLDQAGFAKEPVERLTVTQEESSGVENLGSVTSTASPGVVGLAQSLGPNSSAMEGQSNNAPSLTRFYAEIEDQASREASPSAGPSTVAGLSEIDQIATKAMDGTVEASRMQVSEETLVIARQTEIQQTTVKSIDSEPTTEAGVGQTAVHTLSEVERMEIDKPEQAVQEEELPVESALANLRALNSGPPIDPTIVVEGRASEEEPANGTESPVVQFTSAQQNLIDAVRDTAEGIIPIGGATLEEDDRPDDVPRGLVFSEAEIRYGIRIKPIADLLSNLTDPVLIQEAYLMLERGKAPKTYYRTDTRINEHYEKDLAEYEKLEETRAAKVRKDKAAQASGLQDETVRALVAIDAEDVPDVALPTLALNAEAGPLVDKVPGLVQKKPAPSPVDREVRIDIKTLHPAQLYGLEAFRRRTLKEPALEVTMLEYLATNNLRKQTPPPRSPTPPPASPEQPKRYKAERDAEKAPEQEERDRLAAGFNEAMAQEERGQPLPDDPRDDAYDPQDEVRIKRHRRGKPDSEAEDELYERLPLHTSRRSGPSRGSQRARDPRDSIEMDADAAVADKGQARPKKRGRPPTVPRSTLQQLPEPTPPKLPESTPQKRGRGRPRKEAVASTSHLGNNSRAARLTQQVDTPSEESQDSDMDFGPDNDGDGFEPSPVRSLSPPRRSGRSGNAVSTTATPSVNKKRARSPDPESEEEGNVPVRRTRQRVQHEEATVLERAPRETRSRAGRDVSNGSPHEVGPTPTHSGHSRVEPRPARGTGRSGRGRASGKPAVNARGRSHINKAPEARSTRSAAKQNTPLPISTSPESKRVTRGQAASGSRTARAEGEDRQEKSMSQTPVRPTRTLKQTVEPEPRRSRRNQSPEVRRTRSRLSPKATLNRASTSTPKQRPVETPTAASKRASKVVVASRPIQAKPSSPAVKPRTSRAKQRIQPSARKRSEPMYFDGKNLTKGTFKLEVLVDRMPKKAARRFVRLDLPPSPDGPPVRRPYDGLQEGSARRQALASSEIDPTEDVDQALLNAARQGIESEGSPSPIKSKGKQGQAEEDEVTVNFESEDGYGSRAGSAAEEGSDVDGNPVEDNVDADFENSFAFLM